MFTQNEIRNSEENCLYCDFIDLFFDEMKMTETPFTAPQQPSH